MNPPCFFCLEPAEHGYEGHDDQPLWLCSGHWRLIGETLIEEFEEAEIIASVEFVDEYRSVRVS